MGYKIAKIIYWCVVAIIIGLILSSCSPGLSRDYQLVRLYQRGVPAVVTVRGDEIDDWDSEIRGVGTGFFVNKKYVITNAHIANAIFEGTVELQLWNKQIIPAKIVATDMFYDLALLQIDSNDIKFYKIPKLNLEVNPQIGETIFIIGSPHLFSSTMTKGIFSREATTSDNFWWIYGSEVYFVDAIIEGGNSGSPVFNTRLGVIGIITGHCGKLSVVIPSYNIRYFLKENNGY